MKEKTITIRMNETDWIALDLIREYLEEKYKNLPPRFKNVTKTDCIKYAISRWVYNYSNPEDMSI